jgi:hypothetical protein
MRKLYFPLFLGVASMAGAAVTFHYNVAGYDSNLPKALVVESSDNLNGVNYSIKKDGATVASGTFGVGSIPTGWTNDFTVYYNLDFSQVKTPGSYIVEFESGGNTVTSKAITVADKNLASTTLGLVLNYFRLDRNTMTGHKSATIYGSSQKKDVHGGWSDASGDYGTYLSHLSYANYMNPQQIPLTVWVLAHANEHIPTAVTTATSGGFALDEALWGADFLVRMLSDDGYFYTTVFNGWNASDGGWNLCAFSGSAGTMSSNYQAAYREGGGMAIAALARASTLGKNGDYTSDEYLAAAKTGFDHLESKQTLGGDCAYCDDKKENIIDDYTALMAATELSIATGLSKYMTAARERAEHLIDRLSDEGYFWSDNDKTRPFFHASDAGLPVVALLRYIEMENNIAYEPCPPEVNCINPGEVLMKKAAEAVKKHLDWMISVTDRQNNHFGYAKQVVKTGGKIQTNFFIPHDNETNYWWQGESARLGSLASAAVYASRMLSYTDSVKAFRYAADQLDWLLGKNPFDLSVMKGVGTKNPPVYQSYSSTTFTGGIANGITGKNTDGSGIVWDDYYAAGFSESWQTWRWEEQWLPHATWYLMALATRYDEHPVKVVFPSSSSSGQGSSSSSGSNGDITSSNSGSGSNPTGNSSGSKDKGGKDTDGLLQVATAVGFSVLQSGNTLQVTFANPDQRKFCLMDVHGRVVMSIILLNASNTVQLSTLPKGIYLVHVQGFAPKKIVVR